MIKRNNNVALKTNSIKERSEAYADIKSIFTKELLE